MSKNKIPLSQVKDELYSILADKTLSFGCKIYELHQKTKVSGVFTVTRLFSRNTTSYIDTVERDDIPYSWIGQSEGCGIEIIGHEPLLNDILLKLGEIEDRYSGDYIAVIHDGEIVRGSATWDDYIPVCKYDLTLSFDLQDEETHRKLHKLLKASTTA